MEKVVKQQHDIDLLQDHVSGPMKSEETEEKRKKSLVSSVDTMRKSLGVFTNSPNYFQESKSVSGPMKSAMQKSLQHIGSPIHTKTCCDSCKMVTEYPDEHSFCLTVTANSLREAKSVKLDKIAKPCGCEGKCIVEISDKLPSVFTIALEWQNNESEGEISDTISVLATEIDLSAIYKYEGHSRNTKYGLVSMVCLCGDGCSCIANEKKKWVRRFGSDKEVIGDWNNVVSIFLTRKIRPVLLFFEKIRPSSCSGQWSELPEDLQGLISARLGSIDILSVKSVCRSWLSSWNEIQIRSQPWILCLVKSSGKVFGFDPTNPRKLVYKGLGFRRGVLLGSIKSWVLWSAEDGRLTLQNIMEDSFLRLPKLPRTHKALLSAITPDPLDIYILGSSKGHSLDLLSWREGERSWHVLFKVNLGFDHRFIEAMYVTGDMIHLREGAYEGRINLTNPNLSTPKTVGGEMEEENAWDVTSFIEKLPKDSTTEVRGILINGKFRRFFETEERNRKKIGVGGVG